MANLNQQRLDLIDFRRNIAEVYRLVREHGSGSAGICADFRRRKDNLLRSHPHSPLPEAMRGHFQGLSYYAYDPAYSAIVTVSTDVDAFTIELDLGPDGACVIEQVGRVPVDLPTGHGSLGVFWIRGYCGGLFLPFRDATNGVSTFGGGRYLYDTINGADIGVFEQRLVLDFNYAYSPPSAYNARAVSPLAPPQNTLTFAVPVGERRFEL